MPTSSIWRMIFGVQKTVFERWDLDRGELVFRVRPMSRAKNRCAVCGRRSKPYDRGHGVRRWRASDLGCMRVWFEAERPRVKCRVHGVKVIQVPWARHESGFTHAFEDTVAWLCTQSSKTAVTQLLRVSWATVGRILERVMKDVGDPAELLSNLRRIGIDEISYRRGHRYLTIVVNHDTGQLIWAAPGRDKATVHAFFDACKDTESIEFVTADAASWIQNVVKERCPNAQVCMDPFHVVQWATKALEEVRRDFWRSKRKSGPQWRAAELKGMRWALLKNTEHLTEGQALVVAKLQDENDELYRAYLLKEQLRAVFRAPTDRAMGLLDGWLTWARRCQIPEFVELSKSITRQYDEIRTTLEQRLTNARLEAINTHIRLICRRAYGFHSAGALIAMAMLDRGGLCPALPGRTPMIAAAA